MKQSGNSNQAHLDLANLMNQYTQLLTSQLRSARDLLSHSVQSVMEDVMMINAAVEKGRKEAELALEKVFVSPDEKARAVVDAAQKNTDLLIEFALSHPDNPSTSALPGPSVELSRQLAETYQGHIDHFEDTERLVTDTLLKMTGSLSSDDVIAHYMRHVATSMHVFETGLSSILLDFEGRCTPSNVLRMREELHDFNEKQASSITERNAILRYFPRSV